MSVAAFSSNFKTEIGPVIENLPSAIILIDRDRRVWLANRVAASFAQKSREAFFGRLGGEALGCVNSQKSPAGCGFSPDCEFCKIRQTVMETFETGRGNVAIEVEMEFLQQGPVSISVSTNLLEIGGKQLVILALENISEHKMQDQIRIENARLRVAAQTAAAVCHEMGQPLMAMTGLLDLLIMDSDPNDRKLAETVKEQALRLGSISKQLLNLRSYRIQ